MSSAVLTIVPTFSQAEDLVARLRGDGVRERDVSVVFRDPGDVVVDLQDLPGGWVGAPIGALLPGLGAVPVPGLGRFIAAGPLLATLSGVAAGVTSGGIAGALARLGASASDARLLEDRLLEGNLLVAAHCDHAAQIDPIRDLFQRGGVQPIHVGSRGGGSRA